MEIRNRITLRLRGLDEDNGDVKLNEFVQELEILKKALIETQKIISRDAFAYFKIVELQKNSPALIVIEAVPNKIENLLDTYELVDRFFGSIQNIQEGIYPKGFTYETFTSYKDLTSLQEKKKIADIGFSRNGEPPNYLPDFSRKIETIMGQDEFEFGSYTGMLDAINIHNQNVFYIYPTSHLPKLKCIFPFEQKGNALIALGKYVTVTGQKRSLTNIRGSHPIEMHVYKIDIHPDEKDLPTLRELRGIASRKNGDISADSFTGGSRNDW
jgi:hypothetical protein